MKYNNILPGKNYLFTFWKYQLNSSFLFAFSSTEYPV